MTSTEKVLAFLEGLSDLPDDQLREMIPFASPMRARMGLAAASRYLPGDAEQLDAWATMAIRFMLALRSDDAPGRLQLAIDGELVDDDLDLSALFA